MMTDSYRMSYIPYFFFVFSSEMMSNSWKCRIIGYICSLKWCIYILVLCLLIFILNIQSYSLLLQNMIKRIQSMIILSHNTLWFVKLWFFLLLFTFFLEEYFNLYNKNYCYFDANCYSWKIYTSLFFNNLNSQPITKL